MAEKLIPERVPIVLCELASLQVRIAARLGEVSVSESEEPDRLLKIDETAKCLGISVDCLYKRANSLPFAIKIGKNQLRFSEKGIEEWIRKQQQKEER